MKTIRGAVAPVANEADAIGKAAVQLVNTLCQANGVEGREIVFLLFSATRDLDAAYPAKAVRQAGFSQVPMFCVQEMDVQGSLPACLRVLALVSKDLTTISHIYLGEARQLRRDLCGDDNEKSL